MAREENSRIEDARTAASESIPALLCVRGRKCSPCPDRKSFPRRDAHLPCCWNERTCRHIAGRDRQAKELADELSRSPGAGRAPHTPRLAAMRLLRDLHLMDLVRISLLPASPVELRRLAEERVLAQLPQMPLGQKNHAGSARVGARRRWTHRAGSRAGLEDRARDNSFLTESQLLRTLAKDGLPAQNCRRHREA